MTPLYPGHCMCSHPTMITLGEELMCPSIVGKWDVLQFDMIIVFVVRVESASEEVPVFCWVGDVIWLGSWWFAGYSASPAS